MDIGIKCNYHDDAADVCPRLVVAYTIRIQEAHCECNDEVLVSKRVERYSRLSESVETTYLGSVRREAG